MQRAVTKACNNFFRQNLFRILFLVQSDMFPLQAPMDFNQVHTYDTLKFVDKQMTVHGYPYRFGVANKIDGKVFYRCMDCRNIKNKIKDKSTKNNAIIGTMVLQTKEKLLRGDVNAPNGYAHLCNDPLYRPLPSLTLNTEDLIESLPSRIHIEATFFQFHKHVLKIVNQQNAYKYIGCTEGVRYYVCRSCTEGKNYIYDMNNFLIYNIHQRSLYSNVGGLANLEHVCDDTVHNQAVEIDDEDNNSIETSTVADFNDDFDTVSVSNGAPNVERNKRRHQDFASSHAYDFDDVDSVVGVDENGVGASSHPPQSSDEIEPQPKRRNLSSTTTAAVTENSSKMISSTAACTEAFNIKKLFKWTLNNFNEFNKSNMEQEPEYGYVIPSPELTAVDPFDGKPLKAGFKLVSTDPHHSFSIQPDVTRWRGSGKYRYYYTINNSPDECNFTLDTSIPWNEDIKTFTFFVDVFGYRSLYYSPFKRINPKNHGDRLKEMWKSDSSNKFTIKCGRKSVETYKPLLTARSCYLKNMFQNVTQNSLEITDFEVGVVQKMVEFCETDDIKNCNGIEVGIFKIAHKLQIPDLMDFAVEKMSENANTSNIHGYLQLAIDYKLKDFEEWCKNFAFRN